MEKRCMLVFRYLYSLIMTIFMDKIMKFEKIPL